ncbi:hypothetical protein NLU13_7853 [Sarocladium strictum]|uniref:alcohol dehydrogenase n=1 Tax=Sarocladium strictum TaxID=5046 RepID=A0AA39GFX8_SARSR|nr:hypothetical protein NLU13_7853 [Sarocladium strictum]
MDTPEQLHGQQKVARLINPGPEFSFEIETQDAPSLGSQEALVELEVTGLCGTDLGLARGYLGKCESILGHEGIGRVVAVGRECTKATLGQRVAVGWLRDACGTCRVCLRGDETRCQTQVFSGRDVPGTLARFTVVPDRFLLPVPDDLSAEVLAPIICAGVTAYKALKVCDAMAGSWVAISGAAGGVGTLAIQYARAMGYRPIAIDGGERQKQLCLDLGAEKFIDFTKDKDIASAVSRETDGSLCSAFIECSGAIPAYQTAPSCLDYFGVLVCVGIPPPTEKVSFHPLQLIDKGIQFKGSIVGSRLDTSEAIEFVRRGLVTPRSKVVKLEELGQYVNQLDKIDGKLIVQVSDT